MKIIIIAAIGRNKELGKENSLIWKIPDDLHHFQVLTRDHSVIVGRKTFETLPQPFKRRETLVITQQKDVPNADLVFHSVSAALEYALKTKKTEVYIIGGAEIYKQCLHLAHELVLTLIDAEDKEADTFFPDFEHLFYQRQSVNMQYDDLKYCFTRWSKKD